MKVGVMGAGSIGGYFGGMLARGGHKVSLIARGEHLAEIRRRGLTLETAAGNYVVPCAATDRPEAVGPVDLALLTTKTYHNGAAIPAMAPMVGPDTAVLCLQNGIDSHRPLLAAFPDAVTLCGAAYIEAGRRGPGTVWQAGDTVRIAAGPASGSGRAGDGAPERRAREICAAFRDAGVAAEAVADIAATLWSKFLFIATMAGATALARAPLRELLPRPEWRKIIVGSLAEIERAGRASGVALPSDIVPETLAYLESALASLSASMHADLMAGRPLELEALNGAVVRAGERAGVPTPINDVIYAALQPYADGGGPWGAGRTG